MSRSKERENVTPDLNSLFPDESRWYLGSRTSYKPPRWRFGVVTFTCFMLLLVLSVTAHNHLDDLRQFANSPLWVWKDVPRQPRKARSPEDSERSVILTPADWNKNLGDVERWIMHNDVGAGTRIWRTVTNLQCRERRRSESRNCVFVLL